MGKFIDFINDVVPEKFIPKKFKKRRYPDIERHCYHCGKKLDTKGKDWMGDYGYYVCYDCVSIMAKLNPIIENQLLDIFDYYINYRNTGTVPEGTVLTIPLNSVRVSDDFKLVVDHLLLGKEGADFLSGWHKTWFENKDDQSFLMLEA